jgi:hypothetical protein
VLEVRLIAQRFISLGEKNTANETKILKGRTSVQEQETNGEPNQVYDLENGTRK